MHWGSQCLQKKKLIPAIRSCAMNQRLYILSIGRRTSLLCHSLFFSRAFISGSDQYVWTGCPGGATLGAYQLIWILPLLECYSHKIGLGSLWFKPCDSCLYYRRRFSHFCVMGLQIPTLQGPPKGTLGLPFSWWATVSEICSAHVTF